MNLSVPSACSVVSLLLRFADSPFRWCTGSLDRRLADSMVHRLAASPLSFPLTKESLGALAPWRAYDLAPSRADFPLRVFCDSAVNLPRRCRLRRNRPPRRFAGSIPQAGRLSHF